LNKGFKFICAGAAIFTVMNIVSVNIAADIVQNNTKSLDEALEMIRRGAIHDGTEKLRALGSEGNSEAYFHLGQIYRLDIQGDKSNDTAIRYYRRASEMGNQRASLFLANLLLFDEARTPKKEAEATRLLQMLSLLDNAEAQYILGTLYWNGDAGLNVDPVRGYGLIWRASKLGYDKAITNEVLMASDLTFELRNRSRLYADNLKHEGFGDGPIDLDLVLNSIVTAAGNDQQALLPMGQDRWQINVGLAQSHDQLPSYEIQLQKDVGAYLEGLNKTFQETEDGLHRFLYGPLPTLEDAVTRCVYLKKKGYDCNATVAIENPAK